MQIPSNIPTAEEATRINQLAEAITRVEAIGAPKMTDTAGFLRKQLGHLVYTIDRR